jgi:hypothetical protein
MGERGVLNKQGGLIDKAKKIGNVSAIDVGR